MTTLADAQAAGVLDQSSFFYDGFSSGIFVDIVGAPIGAAPFQTFTPSVTGVLTHVALVLYFEAEEQSVTLNVYDTPGVFTSSPLCATTMTFSSSTMLLKLFNMPISCFLQSSKSYAIVPLCTGCSYVRRHPLYSKPAHHLRQGFDSIDGYAGAAGFTNGDTLDVELVFATFMDGTI